MDASDLLYSNANGPDAMEFHDAVKIIRGLDISPAANPALTIELWIKINSDELPGRGYIIGHDDGGYDRAISVHVGSSLVFTTARRSLPALILAFSLCASVSAFPWTLKACALGLSHRTNALVGLLHKLGASTKAPSATLPSASGSTSLPPGRTASTARST